MFINIKPLGNRVLIKPSTLPEKESKIIIPDCAKEKSMECEVVAVGQGKRIGAKAPFTFEPVSVAPGDHVLVGKYAGTEFKADGEELRVVEEADILAILTRK